jgi:pimeloyl-ACP methyl ester carboxylesterase
VRASSPHQILGELVARIESHPAHEGVHHATGPDYPGQHASHHELLDQRLKARCRGEESELLDAFGPGHDDPTVGYALDRIDTPVIAINPGFKPTDEASFGRRGVELRVIGGVGHFLMMEAPDELNNELQAILNGPLPTRT